MVVCLPIVLASLYIAQSLYAWGKWSHGSQDGLSQSCGEAAMYLAIILAIIIPVIILFSLLILSVMFNLSLALWSFGKSFEGIGTTIRLFSLYGPILLYLKLLGYFGIISITPLIGLSGALFVEAALFASLVAFHISRLHSIRIWQAFAAALSIEIFFKMPLILGLLGTPN